MKTIHCNLTKVCRIFATFTESLYKNVGILPIKIQEISHVYRRIIRSSISLVYVRNIEFVSILTCPSFKGLYLDTYTVFFFRSGVSLKVTYSPLKKRLPFCRSIYVKKVMKLLAFIFEQPSYNPERET